MRATGRFSLQPQSSSSGAKGQRGGGRIVRPIQSQLQAALEADGFVVNPYDLCVTNKIINRSQMTLVWHVDNILASHVDGFQITLLVARVAKVLNELPQ